MLPIETRLTSIRDINVVDTFEFEHVRPGRYKVFAVESWLYEPYQDAYKNPDFLAKYENLGVPVIVQEGQTSQVQDADCPVKSRNSLPFRWSADI